MATRFATEQIPIGYVKLNGGLNTASGPLGVQNHESSDLQNIDFDKFGSILQRNGCTPLDNNVLENNGFEDWTAGNPDNWPLSGTGATVTEETTLVYTGSSATKLTRNGTDAILSQDVVSKFGGSAFWQGRSITVKAKVISDGTAVARIVIDDGVSPTGSSTTTSTSWTDLSVTHTIDNAATAVLIKLETLTSDGSVYYDRIALEINVSADGLHWYEYTSGGATVREIVRVIGGRLQKMDDLDGTWDDVTGSLTITEGHKCSFTNFLDTCIATNNYDVPFKYDGASSSVLAIPTGLTKAKFVDNYQNYCMLANVVVSGVRYSGRFYWSNLKSITSWNAADFIEVGKGDGQEITGICVLGDFLIILKERSIYKVGYTGDRDVPFVVTRTPSTVGCVAGWSIQEVENGLVFLSHDGVYYFDGNVSRKISDRINPTINGMNKTVFDDAMSIAQKNKNRYYLALTNSGSSTNDAVLTWDWANNAFSKYAGINVSAMCIVYVDGREERPYFCDHLGYTYRMDYGTDDYPAGIQTAIDAYYYTNWKHFDDLVDEKGVGHVYLYYQYADTMLGFGYAYDFADSLRSTHLIDLSTGSGEFDSAVFDTDEFADEGGAVVRRDLSGMGRVVRLKFYNNTISETFQIDGIGTSVNAETLA